jgi:transposase
MEAAGSTRARVRLGRWAPSPVASVLSFLSNTRVYLAVGTANLRKAFDTLAGVVRESLRLDPLSGHLFVFTNSRKNRIKILFSDNTGWWVCAKRLEAGTLAWPVSPRPSIELSSGEPALLLSAANRAKLLFSGSPQPKKHLLVNLAHQPLSL